MFVIGIILNGVSILILCGVIWMTNARIDCVSQRIDYISKRIDLLEKAIYRRRNK